MRGAAFRSFGAPDSLVDVRERVRMRRAEFRERLRRAPGHPLDGVGDGRELAGGDTCAVTAATSARLTATRRPSPAGPRITPSGPAIPGRKSR